MCFGYFWIQEDIGSLKDISSARDSTGNALPISLLNFNAEKQEKDVLLYWATGSEINNDYFTIE